VEGRRREEGVKGVLKREAEKMRSEGGKINEVTAYKSDAQLNKLIK